MKLELKHLAPYLPYGLQMSCETMNGLETFKWTLLPNTIEEVLSFKNKPILRPLSELTNEIEINREKFVPIKEIKKAEAFKKWNEGVNEHIGIEYILTSLYPCYLEYWMVEKLLQWHFDIYDLIKNDLAIDINTLDQ